MVGGSRESSRLSMSNTLQIAYTFSYPRRIIEMQAILVELIEKFEFTIPEDKPEIIVPPLQHERFPTETLIDSYHV